MDAWQMTDSVCLTHREMCNELNAGLLLLLEAQLVPNHGSAILGIDLP